MKRSLHPAIFALLAGIPLTWSPPGLADAGSALAASRWAVPSSYAVLLWGPILLLTLLLLGALFWPTGAGRRPAMRLPLYRRGFPKAARASARA